MVLVGCGGGIVLHLGFTILFIELKELQAQGIYQSVNTALKDTRSSAKEKNLYNDQMGS
jgi:hypothetical protein